MRSRRLVGWPPLSAAGSKFLDQRRTQLGAAAAAILDEVEGDSDDWIEMRFGETDPAIAPSRVTSHHRLEYTTTMRFHKRAKARRPPKSTNEEKTAGTRHDFSGAWPIFMPHLRQRVGRGNSRHSEIGSPDRRIGRRQHSRNEDTGNDVDEVMPAIDWRRQEHGPGPNRRQ